MKTVYFMRHGETAGNAREVYQDMDTPLNENGRQQGIVLARRCKKIVFDTLIASTMVRAQETAAYISMETGHEVVSSSLFIERYRPDELGGRAKDDPSIQAIAQAWHDSLFLVGFKVSNGESFRDVAQRATTALSFLEKHDAENIIVVSHGFLLNF